MTKKKIAGTKNVYELAQERLKVIFNEFDNIYVSFSGGKDSGVLLNMCIEVQVATRKGMHTRYTSKISLLASSIRST